MMTLLEKGSDYLHNSLYYYRRPGLKNRSFYH
jgi:hypothetical protein